LRWPILGILTLALFISLTPSSLANPGPVGNAADFEDDDGNLAPYDSGPTRLDWNSFSPVTWNGTAPYQTATETLSPGWKFTGVTDAVNSSTDSGFAGGTKQDDDCPGVVNAPLLNTLAGGPNKADLAGAYFAHKTLANGHVYLALAWTRTAQNTTSSSASVGFEFNQAASGPCPSGSGGLVRRTAGDILIVYDFTGGSAAPVLTLRRWVKSGSCEVNGSSPPCWGTASTLGSGAAEGKVNVTSVDDKLTGTSRGPQEFGEAGIDLTLALGGVSAGCTPFGQAAVVSRSSGNSGSATMEDLVGPASFTLSNCGELIVQKVTNPTHDLTNTPFPFTATGPPSQPGGTNFQTAFTLLGGHPAAIHMVVGEGSYSVTEAVPDNWSLTDAACLNELGTPVGTPGTTPGTITAIPITADDTVTCTYTDTYNLASLAITKRTIDAFGKFVYGVQPAVGGNAIQQTATTTSDSNPAPALPVEATAALPIGTYVITEAPPLPLDDGGTWEGGAPTCTTADGTRLRAPPQAGGGYAVTLPPQSVVTCAFVNTYVRPDAAALVITKQTHGAIGGPFDYTVQALGTSGATPIPQQAMTEAEDTPVTAEPRDQTAALMPGEYLITETVSDAPGGGTWGQGAPTCTAADDSAIDATPQDGGYAVTLPAASIVTCAFTNTYQPPPTGAIKITKTSTQPPPAFLPGATFKVTGGPTPVPQPLTTGLDGTVCIDKLQIGVYTVTETKPPEGFSPADPDNLPVDVNRVGNCTTPDTATSVIFSNAPIPPITGAIKITKTSRQPPPAVLPGATFTISDGPTNVPQPVTTGPDGTVCVDKLQIGVYTVTETKPPAGYAPADPDNLPANVGRVGDCTTPDTATSVIFSNAPIPLTGAIRIIKTSSQPPPAVLPGAIFTVSGGPTDVPQPLTTGPDGTVCIDKLQIGVYTVTESKPPEGYAPADPDNIPADVGRVGDCSNPDTATTVSFSNAPIPLTGAIKIIKTSSQPPPAVLPGATFSISGGPTDVPQSLATGPDGTVCVDNLQLGVYTVTESAPPAGYSGSTPNNRSVDVGRVGDCTTGAASVSFSNAPISTATPATPVPTGTPITCLTPTITATATFSATPTFTATPPATATPTLTRAPTLTSTSTPTATRTPQNGAEVVGGATAKATSTPIPSATPTVTGTPSPTGTPTLTLTPTATPTATILPTPEVASARVVARPTPGPHDQDELTLLNQTVTDLAGRRTAPSPQAPVPPPPVQLPPVVDDVYNWIMSSVTAAQELPPGADVCAMPEISMTNSAAPSSALVGEPVSFTFTVNNTGTVDLVDLQVESSLPAGLGFVSATSSGTMDQGYVKWTLDSGLAAGASTQLSVSATITNPGEFTNTACSAGLDALDNQAQDCDSATVIGLAPTMTPTPTITPTQTLTAVPSATPSTPEPAQPIATPPAGPAQPIATPPGPAQPIATPPSEPSQPIATPPSEPAQPIASPPPEPSQPIAPPPSEPSQPTAPPPSEPSQPVAPPPEPSQPIAPPPPESSQPAAPPPSEPSQPVAPPPSGPSQPTAPSGT
jgi:uncharacterized repeat protein (TIGR01451 family)